MNKFSKFQFFNTSSYKILMPTTTTCATINFDGWMLPFVTS